MFRRLAPFCLLLASAPSLAGIDAEVGNGDKITGTLSPATEAETFRVRVPNGAKLTVKAKAAKKGPALHVVLSFPAAASLTADGKAASIGATATSSGLYAVTVTSLDGTSTGDYSLSISWKSPTKFSKTTDLANAQTDTLTFAADAGAAATITAKAAKKSKATGVLSSLNEPGNVLALLSGASVKRTLGDGGDYVLTFSNAGATQGAVTATVKLKLPKALKRSVALTSKVIDPGGAKTGFAYANVLGPDGGTVTVPVILPGQPGADISGSSVSVPPGSLGAGSAIVIATAPDIAPPPSLVGAGPTVFFGPEGTQFDKKDKSKKATISIPYNASVDTAFLQIYTRDAKGKVTLVPQPYTFDTAAHTVSFSTSHFSSFRAEAPDTGLTIGMLTYANLADPRDLCPGNEATIPSLPALYFVAEGTARVVGALRLSLTSGIPTHEIWAGGGAQTADGTPRLQYQFPDEVLAVDSLFDGQVWIATRRQVFHVGTDEKVSLYAGTGVSSDTGDNGPATSATFSLISAIAADDDGTLYVADIGAHRIRRIDPTSHTIFAWAGSGQSGLGADGDPLESTTMLGPNDIALAHPPLRGLFVADAARVRQFAPAVIGMDPLVNVTVAGSAAGASGSTGDGGPVLQARFFVISGVATYLDVFNPTATKLMVTDSQDHTVRMLDLTGDKVFLVCGQHNTPGFSGDQSPLPGLLDGPRGLVVNSAEVGFADQGNGKVRTRFATVTGFE